MAEFQALIIFGDGLQAIYHDEKPEKFNRKSVRVKPLFLTPSEELRRIYNIEDDEIIIHHGNKGVWMEYPIRQMFWRRRSRTGAVLDIFCGYDGRRCEIMGLFDGKLEAFQNIERENQLMRFYTSKIFRELENVTTQEQELYRIQQELMEARTPSKNNWDDDEDN